MEIGLPGRIQLDLYYDWVVEAPFRFSLER